LQVSDYEKEIVIMKTVTKEEYLASLRRYFIPLRITLLNKLSNSIINVIGFDVCSYRRSSGFSRGVSKYRGVATCKVNQLSTTII
jgi:hypothetical protein